MKDQKQGCILCEDDPNSTQHYWGCDKFDWKSLDEACRFIYNYSRRYARFGVHVKEKYGTLRISLTLAYSFYDWPIHSLFKPGHVCYRWPKWVRKYIDTPLSKLFRLTGITKLVIRYQEKVFKRGWQLAAKKYPSVREAILDEWGWHFGDKK